MERDELNEIRTQASLAKQKADLVEISTNKEMKALHDRMDMFVTKYEFAPVKLMAYGLAISIGTGVIGAILSKVFIK